MFKNGKVMKVVDTISGLEKIADGCVLTIGNFDGVHVGHQTIISSSRAKARKKGCEVVVMTFEPHPAALLCPEKAPERLTSLELKTQLLDECGVDCLVVLRDSIELLKLSPAEFVEEFLVKHISPSVVFEGENFRFGAGRAGNVHMLHSLGMEKGFGVSIIESQQVKLSIGPSVKVSSTIIRNLLKEGKVADAAVALGRAYRLIGRIVPGKGKGKQLGFPTLNMKKPEQLVPAEGVYAGTVEIGESFEQVRGSEQKRPAVFSIGKTSTYGGDNPLLIEAHLLGADAGETEGKYMAMDFARFIRGQQKFESEKGLSQQIKRDCEKAKKILGEPYGAY